jgi:hypothetical protein
MRVTRWVALWLAAFTFAVYAQVPQVGVQGVMVASPGTGQKAGGGVRVDGVWKVLGYEPVRVVGYAQETYEPKLYVGDGSATRLGGDVRYTPGVLAEAFEDFSLRPYVAVGGAWVNTHTSQYSKSAGFVTAGVGINYKDYVTVGFKRYFTEHQTANKVRANELAVDAYVPLDKQPHWLVRAGLLVQRGGYWQPSGVAKGFHGFTTLQLGVGAAYKF